MYYGTSPIVTQGLLHYFDSVNTLSYTSGSSQWRSITGASVSASLFTSSFASNVIGFNGTSSYGDLTPLTLSGSFTLNIVFSLSAGITPAFLDREALVGGNSGSVDIRGLELSSSSSISLRNLGVYIEEEFPIPDITPGNFYYLTVLRNSDNTINTYLNGNRTDLGISTTNLPGIITVDALANMLRTRYLNGSLSHISTYSRALTQSEIRQNVNALSTRYRLDTSQKTQSLPQTYIDLLRVRAQSQGAILDSKMYSSSLADLQRLHNLDLLESASIVVTPATVAQGVIYNVKPRKYTYNLLKYTQDYNPGGWAYIRMSASLGLPDPQGTTSAALITVTGSGTVRMNQSVLLTPNHPYNVSWYLSQSNARYANVIFQDAGEGLMSSIQVDFVSQSFTIKNGGAPVSFNPRNLRLDQEADNWYRASFTITSIANRSYKTQVIPNTSSLGAYPSDVGAAVHVYGAQISKGEELLPYQRIITASNPDSMYRRGTSSTAIDENGYISQFPYNYVGDTNNSLNIGGGTVQRAALLAPDGTYTADIFTKTNNMSVNREVYPSTVSPHNGTQYTISFWTKLADTGSNISMQVEVYPVSGSTFLTPLYPGNYTITNQWQKIERVITVYEKLVSYYSVRAARQTATTGDLIGRSFSIWGLNFYRGSGSRDTQIGFSQTDMPTIDYTAGAPAIRAVVYAENTFRWSNSLDNTVWIKDRLTATTSSVLTPSGEYNAYTLTATASNAALKQSPNTNNRIGLFSAYLRRRTGSSPIELSVGAVTASVLPTADWALYQVDGQAVTGSYTASAGSYTVNTAVPHGLEVGNTFYAILTGVGNANPVVSTVPGTNTITFTTGTATATGNCTIHPHNARLTILQQGDAVDIHSPQFQGTGWTAANSTFRNNGVNYAKEFIPTITSAITRNTEVLEMADIAAGVPTNSTSGSLFIEFAYPHTPNPFYTTFDMMQVVNTQRVQIFNLQAQVNQNIGFNGYRWVYTPQASTFTGTQQVALKTFQKSVIVFTTNSLRFHAAGGLVSTTNITTAANLAPNRIVTGSPYLLIKQLIYLPYALSSAKANEMTT